MVSYPKLIPLISQVDDSNHEIKPPARHGLYTGSVLATACTSAIGPTSSWSHAAFEVWKGLVEKEDPFCASGCEVGLG